MLYQIACLHTAESNVAIFEAALHELGMSERVALRHEVRQDLLADAEAQGGLTPELAIRARNALLGVCDGSDAVLLTCSTLGPAIEGLTGTRVPIMRVDEALAHEAVQNGGEVVVLCAVETTIIPTRSIFEQAASLTGARIDLRLVQGAWSAFKAGQQERYLGLIADAAEHAFLAGSATVALAQASMAGAAKLIQADRNVLTSPAAGLLAAAKAAGAI